MKQQQQTNRKKNLFFGNSCCSSCTIYQQHVAQYSTASCDWTLSIPGHSHRQDNHPNKRRIVCEWVCLCFVVFFYDKKFSVCQRHCRRHLFIDIPLHLAPTVSPESSMDDEVWNNRTGETGDEWEITEYKFCHFTISVVRLGKRSHVVRTWHTTVIWSLPTRWHSFRTERTKLMYL